ncbi:tRNA (adenosine(37)-N6)-threonylcarbamoyltransferase complex dimerization subunit type 1 TsaB [Parapedobacter defluvii]|uniref:tRNA (adenosine(37)-N6)-threonylcarbamoyltransferase complex dimerization subunit type 1 TsaB n=1 Tax=Parapedobacter defluvii TaxID=2045106 RepID=UPI00333EBBC6
MSNHHILQLETATQVCSAALSTNGETIAFRDVNEPNIHASRLTLLIEEILRETGLSFPDLSAVAVSKGPGSYTGLRIGVSTAKGLCYATDLPLIGIDTLAGMAAGFKELHKSSLDADTWLCPMIDARRMEVYRAIYDQALRPLAPVSATIIDAQSFDTLKSGQRIVLFGSGADKLNTLFSGNERVEIIADFKNSAQHVSHNAYRKFLAGEFVDVAYFEPYYLKDFVTTTPKK